MPRVHFRSADDRAVYRVWMSMHDRCRREAHPMYGRYGGRGIKVCERWRTFENFVDDMGPRPTGMTLERKDNDGPYSPGNCEWATAEKQNRNRSGLTLITIHGEVMPARTAWRKYCQAGITYEAFLNRLHKQGMTPEAAATNCRQSWQRARAA
jgi:hypothetical protein